MSTTIFQNFSQFRPQVVEKSAAMSGIILSQNSSMKITDNESSFLSVPGTALYSCFLWMGLLRKSKFLQWCQLVVDRAKSPKRALGAKPLEAKVVKKAILGWLLHIALPIDAATWYQLLQSQLKLHTCRLKVLEHPIKHCFMSLYSIWNALFYDQNSPIYS